MKKEDIVIKLSNNPVIKLDNYNINDFNNDLDKIESISNAFCFLTRYDDSNDDIKKYKNPFNISEKLLESSFGKYNFVDNYKGSKWWVFTHHNNTFYIVVNSFEGSLIYLKQEKPHMIEKEFSDIMLLFYEKLFETIL